MFYLIFFAFLDFLHAFSLDKMIIFFKDYYFTPIRVFHASVSWYFFTGVWVRACLLKSLQRFSVFYADLNYAVVWIVFTCLITKFYSPFTNPYLPNPSARAGYDIRSIFKRSLTGLNSEFSFSYTTCLTKAEETSLPDYLPIAGGRIIGFIPFPSVLVLCEMQSASSRIWTRVSVSISYDDNHYTLGTFTNLFGIVPSASITIAVTITNISQIFFCSQARSRYLSLFSGLPVQQNPLFGRFFFFFLLTITKNSSSS